MLNPSSNIIGCFYFSLWGLSAHFITSCMDWIWFNFGCFYIIDPYQIQGWQWFIKPLSCLFSCEVASTVRQDFNLLYSHVSVPGLCSLLSQSIQKFLPLRRMIVDTGHSWCVFPAVSACPVFTWNLWSIFNVSCSVRLETWFHFSTGTCPVFSAPSVKEALS